MKTFRQYLTEATNKNTHLEHLEDEVFNSGVAGAKSALAFLRGLRGMLSGSSKSSVNVTVKWDGAPAIICGINPENGKFFVGTKSVFNKDPKLNYTDADIDANHDGSLAQKLKVCLSNLKGIGIRGVIQGDLLFIKGSVETMEYDGEQYVSFKANTIRYAVPANSSLAADILAANLGIVFHTTYSGKKIQDMKASFGADVSGLKTGKVWVQDAYFRDASGNATLTKDETVYVSERLSDLNDLIKELDSTTISSIVSDNRLRSFIKEYVNSKVRVGERIAGTKKYASGLVEFIQNKFLSEIEKLKTDKGKSGKEDQLKQTLLFIKQNQKQIVSMFLVSALIQDVKGIFINKLRRVSSIGTFLETPDGYKVTSPEGFVAIDKIGKAYKLVDRLEFSRANLTNDKGW